MDLPLNYHNIDAEREAIVSLLINEDTQHLWLPELNDTFFCDPCCRRIYQSLEKKAKNIKTVVMPDLTDDLSDDDLISLVGSLEAQIFTSFKELHRILDRYRQVRETMKIIHFECGDPANIDPSAIADKILALSTGKSEYEKISIKNLTGRKLDQWQTGKDRRKTYYLGIPLIDDIVRLKKGNTCIIAAPRKTGKTWMEASIASFLSQGNKVLFISAEMAPEDLYTRIASRISRHDLTPLDYMTEPPKRLYEAFAGGVDGILERDLDFINARGITVSHLIAEIKQAINQGYEVIILDYLQRIAGIPVKDYRIGFAELSRNLANLFAKNDVLGIVAAQANKAPKGQFTEGTKESRAADEDADCILYLTDLTDKTNGKHQPGELYDLMIEIVQRNGMSGGVKLKFDPKTGIYHDPATVDSEVEKRFT